MSLLPEEEQEKYYNSLYRSQREMGLSLTFRTLLDEIGYQNRLNNAASPNEKIKIINKISKKMIKLYPDLTLRVKKRAKYDIDKAIKERIIISISSDK